MKQIFAIVLLAVILTACDDGGSGAEYARRLRDSANGQPGAQVATEARPAPTMPPPPEQAKPSQLVESVKAAIWRDDSQAPDKGEAVASIAAFIGSPAVIYIFAAVVAGLVMRKKVRK